MHLRELLSSRPRPAAAVFLTLTRRCPLHCAHCSTSSAATSEQAESSIFSRFVSTFTPADRPDFLLMTGGEPLLRPELVTRLARSAGDAGCRSYVLTGGFFARHDRPSRAVDTALGSVDHVALSLDVFHEAEVPRPLVFRAAHRIRSAGTSVSFQVIGTGDDDPYLAEVTDAIRAEFADQVPVLVGRLGRVGRARDRMVDPIEEPADEAAGPAVAEPCTAAAWPVVGFDGTVTACANQSVVDHAPLPAHLVLGHAARDDWPTIRDRCQRTPLLEALRTVGPRYLLARGRPSGGVDTPTGYCRSCWRLSEQPGLFDGVGADPARPQPVSPLLAKMVLRTQMDAGAVGFARRYGSPRYADLVTLGANGGTARASDPVEAPWPG